MKHRILHHPIRFTFFTLAPGTPVQIEDHPTAPGVFMAHFTDPRDGSADSFEIEPDEFQTKWTSSR